MFRCSSVETLRSSSVEFQMASAQLQSDFTELLAHCQLQVMDLSNWRYWVAIDDAALGDWRRLIHAPWNTSTWKSWLRGCVHPVHQHVALAFLHVSERQMNAVTQRHLHEWPTCTRTIWEHSMNRNRMNNPHPDMRYLAHFGDAVLLFMLSQAEIECRRQWPEFCTRSPSFPATGEWTKLSFEPTRCFKGTLE